MASRAIDMLITYRVVKLLITPWEKQEAFKQGIIDKKGKVLRPNKTLQASKDKKAYTYLHRFVFNMKRLFGKVGLGSRFGSFFAALAMVLKEDKQLMVNKDAIEAGLVEYLKETNQYENMLNEIRDIPDIDDEPVMTCLGVGIYEQNKKLVSEYEYAKTL
jgi:hypothetical protein